MAKKKKSELELKDVFLDIVPELFPPSVLINGEKWTIEIVSEDLGGEDGYVVGGTTEEHVRRIRVKEYRGTPAYEDEEYHAIALMKHILRHELWHAMICESGLSYNTLAVDIPWAVNEEMVDFLAKQTPKMIKLFRECGVLDD